MTKSFSDNTRGPFGDIDVLSKPEQKTKKPSMFQVILLNDDFTPREFVVHILKAIFHKDTVEAEQIMMKVHNSGSAIAGTYPLEIAESKCMKVIKNAKENEYPLQCTVEEVGE